MLQVLQVGSNGICCPLGMNNPLPFGKVEAMSQFPEEPRFLLTVYVFVRKQDSRSVGEITCVRTSQENHVDRLLL